MPRGRRQDNDEGDPATAYATAVVEGDVVACRWVRLAAARHLRDLDEGPRRGLRWLPGAASEQLAFFAGLRHSKGEWAGSAFALEPWEAFILGSLFGWRRADGRRRFKTAYIEVPRKNGKSTLAAGLGLQLAFFDAEPGAEVYAAATKRAQALIVFSEAKRMTLRTPELRRRIAVQVGNLHMTASDSKFEPLGADADNLDGLNIHAAIVDELHAHKTRTLWDVLATGTGARRQPVLFAITTAGTSRAGVCYDQHRYVEQILEGAVTDDATFGIIYTIDEGDDWRSPASWAKANPNLGVSVKTEILAELAAQAEVMPSARAAFQTKRLNVWVNAAEGWLDAGQWVAAAVPEYRPGPDDECFLGLDLGTRRDVTAKVELTRRRIEEGWHYHARTRFWYPQGRVRGPDTPATANYAGWAESGALVLTPGNATDFPIIEEELRRDLAALPHPLSIAFDPWQSHEIMTKLHSEGAPVVEVAQNMRNLSAPMKELEALLATGRFTHDGNPVMTWMVSNVGIRRDSADNILPIKTAEALKIDGVVALIMALARALVQAPSPPSVYETRGVLAL